MGKDLGFRIFTGIFGLVLVALVVAIGFELARQSILSIEKFGLSFWVTEVWDPVAGRFGAFPFIWGTLYSSILALLIATPIALGIAVFVSELCPAWLRQPLVFLTELLAAIPSIVYGLWGIFVVIPAIRPACNWLTDHLGWIPIFSTRLSGPGLLPAALAHTIGSDTQRPFAIVIVGGLLPATLLTMLLLPAFYQLADRWFGSGWRARHPSPEEVP